MSAIAQKSFLMFGFDRGYLSCVEQINFSSTSKLKQSVKIRVDVKQEDEVVETPDVLNALLQCDPNNYVGLVSQECTIDFREITQLFETNLSALDTDIFYSDYVVQSKFKKHKQTLGNFLPKSFLSYPYLGVVLWVKASLLIQCFSSVTQQSKTAKTSLWELIVEALKLSSSIVKLNSNAVTVDSTAECSWRDYEPDEELITKSLNSLSLHLGFGNHKFDVHNQVFYSDSANIEVPLVSIVIPSRGIYDLETIPPQSLLVNAVTSIVEKSSYSNFELVIVLDANYDSRILEKITEYLGDRVRFITWNEPFSFSKKMNKGVLAAKGEYILLLNDDVEVISPDWIDSMLVLAQLDNSGLVGSMLYFEDESIQHAGHAYFRGSPTHIGINAKRNSPGPNKTFLIEREAPGVTAACALISKKKFLEVGGFCTLLPGNFNDVDLCLKLRSVGYTNYWTPKSELFHFESKSRDPYICEYERQILNTRWRHLLSDSTFLSHHPHNSR